MEIVPATPERWDDLADLFTRRGPRGGLQHDRGLLVHVVAPAHG